MDVKHRIKCGIMKWREMLDILCDKRIPMRLKNTFYRRVVRPMLYGSECWVVDRRIEQSMSIAGMRMFRWMSGATRDDRMKNEYMRSIGVVSIVSR
jgi:hypothetical protein